MDLGNTKVRTQLSLAHVISSVFLEMTSSDYVLELYSLRPELNAFLGEFFFPTKCEKENNGTLDTENVLSCRPVVKNSVWVV